MMSKGWIVFWVMGWLLTANPGWAKSVTLATHNLPPYGSFEGEVKPMADDDFSGVAYQLVSCAIEAMGWTLNTQVTRWEIAQQRAQNHQVDGFFAASAQAQRDEYATLSAPVAEQNWVWYQLADHPLDPRSRQFKKEAWVSSFEGSNMQHWLQFEAYQLAPTPVDIHSLLAKLFAGELDAILANNNSVQTLLANRPDVPKLKATLQSEKPLGVYFTHYFLEQHPGFLSDFNRQLLRCRLAALVGE